jgi:hypothetical protein
MPAVIVSLSFIAIVTVQLPLRAFDEQRPAFDVSLRSAMGFYLLFPQNDKIALTHGPAVIVFPRKFPYQLS